MNALVADVKARRANKFAASEATGGAKDRGINGVLIGEQGIEMLKEKAAAREGQEGSRK